MTEPSGTHSASADAIPRTGSRAYRFGNWTVRPDRLQLARDGRVVELEPRVMEVLLCIAAGGGDAVPREQLHATVWPGTFVTDKALTGAVSKLRKALEDDPASPRHIGTVSKGGYRILAEWTAMDDAAATSNVSPDGPLPGTLHQATDGARATSTSRPGVAARVAASAVAALALAGASWALWPAPPRAHAAQYAVTTAEGYELHPALSPSGDDVVYSAADENDNWDLYLTRPGSPARLRLTTDPGRDVRPAWSPDATEIAFLRFTDDQCRLLVMPALGGEARQIAWCPEFVPARVFWGPRLAWSHDGKFIARSWRDDAEHSARIQSVDVATGATRPLTRPAPGFDDAAPALSPDGRWLAFSRRRRGGTADIWLQRLTSGAPTGAARRLTHENRTLMGHAWTPDSSAVIVSSNRDGTFNFWRAGIDDGALRWIPAPGWNLKGPSVAARTGRLAYENWIYDNNIWRVELDGAPAAPTPTATGVVLRTRFGGVDERAAPLIVSNLWDVHPAIAPDGQRLAFVSNRSGTYEIWSADPDGRELRQLTHFGGAVVGSPTWTADGERIVFEARPEGQADLYSIAADGSDTRRLTHDAADDVLANVAGDDVYFASRRSGDWQVWRLDAEGAAHQVTATGGYAPQMAADGSLIYARDGEFGLWRQRPGASAPERLLPTLWINDWGNWTVAGRWLYFVRRGDEAGLARYDLVSGGVEHVFTPEGTILDNQRGLSVSPDGRWLLFTAMDASSADIVVVDGLDLR